MSVLTTNVREVCLFVHVHLWERMDRTRSRQKYKDKGPGETKADFYEYRSASLREQGGIRG